MSNKITAFLVVLTSVLALGYAHGRLTDRWGLSDELLRAAERLNTVPNEISGWVGTDQEISEQELDIAEAQGYLSRWYVNGETGERVQVMILCGRPGPISGHPPTVCFVGGGADRATPVSAVSIATGDAANEFQTADFIMVGPDVVQNAQRTYWSWSPNGQSWTSPEGDQRVAVAGESHLYKLYFTTPVESRVGSDEYESTSDNVTKFMETMLDVLAERLRDDET